MTLVSTPNNSIAQKCGAKNRQGNPCQRPVVEGANRCRYHGGLSPRGENSASYKHGRYSKYVKGAIADKLDLLEDDNPLDLMPELQIQKVLFAEYLSRFEVGVSLSAGDINMLMQWSTQITQTVERLVKMQNETALTAAEVQYIALRMSDLIMKYITDDKTREAFTSELFEFLRSAHTE